MRTKQASDKSVPVTGLKLDFSESPTIFDFISSKSFVQGMMMAGGLGEVLRLCCQDLHPGR